MTVKCIVSQQLNLKSNFAHIASQFFDFVQLREGIIPGNELEPTLANRFLETFSVFFRASKLCVLIFTLKAAD